ncbi:MAG: acyl-CoA dehydrogenase family protein [Hahellaceae bacterium]|nr:acyl-CoA dehydrogenase family protein [Hahellaceae bacterium]
MESNGLHQADFDLFIKQVQKYVLEQLVPCEKEVFELNRVPEHIIIEMKEMGMFGVTTPEKYGGSGMNISQYIQFIEEISWAAPAFRAILSINTGMMTTAILKCGTEEQRVEWLPRLAAGEIACFGLTEPDSGSDAAALATRAVADGDEYVINGSKRYITNAPLADVALIMARTSSTNLAKHGHISAFLVPMSTSGVTVGKPDRKMGQAGAQIADIILDDVRVPRSALLGGVEGRGFMAAMQSIDSGRFSVAAISTGYAKRILASGLRYSMERKAFGETISNFQLIQAMLADSNAEIYAAECMLRDGTAKADRGQRVTTEAACAKMFASEMCGRVADRVVQIHGGAGYLAEYDAERFYRDVRVFRIYEGTTQIMQLLIAKAYASRVLRPVLTRDSYIQSRRITKPDRKWQVFK